MSTDNSYYVIKADDDTVSYKIFDNMDSASGYYHSIESKKPKMISHGSNIKSLSKGDTNQTELNRLFNPFIKYMIIYDKFGEFQRMYCETLQSAKSVYEFVPAIYAKAILYLDEVVEVHAEEANKDNFIKFIKPVYTN